VKKRFVAITPAVTYFSFMMEPPEFAPPFLTSPDFAHPVLVVPHMHYPVRKENAVGRASMYNDALLLPLVPFNVRPEFSCFYTFTRQSL